MASLDILALCQTSNFTEKVFTDERRTDEWTDERRTDGWTNDEPTDGRTTDGRTEKVPTKKFGRKNYKKKL